MFQHTKFTRLDLVFIVAIFGCLAALIAPALLSARESIRRRHCSDNLRQIGQALNSYYNVHKELPPASVQPNNDNSIILWAPEGESRDVMTASHANWAVLLLPYLGREDIFKNFDARVPIHDSRNEKVRTTELPVMSCPSDSYNFASNAYVMKQLNGTESVFSRGNYGINMGSTTVFFVRGKPGFPHPDGMQFKDEGNIRQWWGNGVAGFNKSFSFKDFTNGLSTTVAVDEIRTGLLPVDCRGVWGLGIIGASITHANGQAGDCTGPNPPKIWSDDTYGAIRLHHIMDNETIANEGMTCCDHHTTFYQAGARSLHPEGVHVLMMDGAVYFVRNDVDMNVWHLIHSRETPRKIDIRGLTAPASEGPFLAPDLEGDWADNVSSKTTEQKQPGPEHSKDSELIINSMGMKLCRIPAGEFTMGLPNKGLRVMFPLETPEHRVRITKPFYLGMHEVTQKEYKRIMGTNPSWHSVNRMEEIKSAWEAEEKRIAAEGPERLKKKLADYRKAWEEPLNERVARQEITAEQAAQERIVWEENEKREGAKAEEINRRDTAARKANLEAALSQEEARVDNEKQELQKFPVNQVSWYDAVEFCRRLSLLPEEQAVGRRYHLPTEAQWEYAGRGGDASPEDDDLDLQKRHDMPIKAVGSAPPNAFGLYDMSENVNEWCSDWFAADYYYRSPRDDPQGPPDGALRIVRGSNWIFYLNCQFFEHPMDPILKSQFIGFRVVCEAKAP